MTDTPILPSKRRRAAASRLAACLAVLLLAACDTAGGFWPQAAPWRPEPVRARLAVSATPATPIEYAPRTRAPAPMAAPAAPVETAAAAPLPAAGTPAGTVAAPEPAVPAAFATAPAPLPAPAAVWSIKRGATLKATLEGWAREAPCPAIRAGSWTVVWKTRRAYEIEAAHELDPALDFPAAADRLLELFARHASSPIDWAVWTGNCAVVVSDRPRRRRKQCPLTVESSPPSRAWRHCRRARR